MTRLKREDKWRVTLTKEGKMQKEARIFASDKILIDEKAVEQLKNAASLPSVTHALATPDIHTGYGVPIGAVVATRDIVVPAAVGYDINCGMRLISTPFSPEKLDLQMLAREIARLIPLGEGKHNVTMRNKELRRLLDGGMEAYLETDFGDRTLRRARVDEEEEQDRLHMENCGWIEASTNAVSRKAIDRGSSQLGTLGGGNHFIEFQLVQEVYRQDIAHSFGLRAGQVAVMIHSGSRGMGHEVGGYYMQMAKARTRATSPSAELCYLDADSKDGKDFLKAMGAAANFAFLNRQVMGAYVRHAIRQAYGDVPLPLIYDVTHNMVKREKHGKNLLWVHRKGATRAFPASRMQNTPFAQTGQPVLIPGSMGTASYVLVGTEESSESLHSVNHGAGRVLSRSAARGKKGKGKKGPRPAAISDKEFARSMEGVHLVCNSRRTIKEEAPGAYKDIDAVISVVKGAGLALPVVRLCPLAVLKG